MTGWCWDFIMNGWDFHNSRRSFHDDRSKFSWWQIQNSIRTGGDFHGDRWRFCFEQLRTSRWQVKNFMVTSRDFIINSWLFNIFIMKDRFTMNGWGFHNGRSRFSWWLVEILLWMVEMVEIWFMTRGRNFHEFHVGRWRFSWRQVEILLWTVQNFLMTGRGIHDDRLRFSWWLSVENLDYILERTGNISTSRSDGKL